MKTDTVRLIARLLWVLPAILAFLVIHQIMVGLDIRETVRTGEPATAEVIEFDTTERSEITYAYVTLRVRMADGREFVRERMSLPQTLIGDVRYAEELDVIVRPGADQEVVIQSIGETHWKVALGNGLMSLFGFIMLTVGVYAWNRYLSRSGDPGRQIAA